MLKTVKENQELFQSSATQLQEKISTLERVFQEKAAVELECNRLRKNIEDLVR